MGKYNSVMSFTISQADKLINELKLTDGELGYFFKKCHELAVTGELPDDMDRFFTSIVLEFRDFRQYQIKKAEDDNARKRKKKEESLEETEIPEKMESAETDPIKIKEKIKIKDKEIIKDNSDAKASKSKRFSPPTLKEVEDEISKKGYIVNAQSFMSYYESNGWKVGRNKMVSWTATLAQWNARDRERLKNPTSYGSTKKRISDINERQYKKGELDMDLNDPTAIF